MLASQLAKIVNGQLVGDDFEFDHVAFSSNDCNPGTLFIALPGSKTHGAKFATQAMQNGASGLLTDVEPEASNYVLVRDAFEAVKKLGETLVRSYSGKIVVVLGASGKTTLKELARSLAPVRVWSSYGNRNTIISLVTDLFNERESALNAPYWILEFGIHDKKDADDFLQVFNPYVALFTSLGAEHLEFLENVDVAVRTNLKVGMAATKRFALVSDECSVEDAVLFGSPQTNAWFDISSFTCDGCTLGKLMCNGEERDVVLPFWGKRSAQSVAGAAAFWVSEGFGLDELPWENLDTINIWGRQQLTRWGDLLIFFDAYNANPESMKELLEVVSEVPYDKKGLVIGDMLELGEYSHYWHRKLAHWLKKSGIQYLILVGNEVKYTLRELEKVDGHAMYVEWYRDVETARSFFMIPEDIELLGLKGSRRIALEKLIQEVSEVEF